MKTIHWSKNTLLVIGSVVTILLILGLSIWQMVQSKIQKIPLISYSDSSSIQMLEENLKNKNLDDQTRKSLESKLQVYYSNATQKANALLRQTIPTEQLTAVPRIPIISAGKRMTGIIDRPSVPFPSSAYLIENAWQEKINGVYVLVFAGVVADDLQQGILIIQSDENAQSDFIYTPQKLGAVRITHVDGFQLVLQAKNQDYFYFDVPGRLLLSLSGILIKK